MLPWALALAALLSGCVAGSLDQTTPAHQPPATAAWSDAVKSGAIPAGMGRIYVFLGTWNFPDAQWFKEAGNTTPADIYVNGVNVGGLNPGECLTLDLPPGAYSFAWFERSQYPYPAVALQENLGKGEALFLSADANQHADGAFANPVSGYLTEQQGGLAKIKMMTIVMPDADAVKASLPGASAPF